MGCQLCMDFRNARYGIADHSDNHRYGSIRPLWLESLPRANIQLMRFRRSRKRNDIAPGARQTDTTNSRRTVLRDTRARKCLQDICPHRHTARRERIEDYRERSVHIFRPHRLPYRWGNGT